MALILKSQAFTSREPIPAPYTYDGGNTSPGLSWEGVPNNTRSLALIVDDPDAPRGVFTHWVVYNIPPNVTSLPEGMAATPTLDHGAKQGRNDYGEVGYGGPKPPPGPPHHYRFTLYALDTELGLQLGATKQRILEAMHGHVIAQTQLVGIYQNPISRLAGSPR